MDRRNYGDQSFFTRSVHGSSYFGNHRAPEDDLVARSREWINRPERERGDPWRRSVDDFLDSKPGRYHRPRDRSRSRSRERDWDRKGRDRSREREFRRRSPHDDGDNRSYGDRRYREYQSRKYSRENSEEKRAWDSGEEENSSSYKSEQDFDSDKAFMPGYTADGSLRPEDRFAYERQTPQRTIIIRGMAQHITEVDIQDDITACGLTCRDIRLVRRKDTGTSRGFAFVEFNTVEDATSWIELKQGELMLKDHFRALLQYSMPKDQPYMKGKWQSDWICRCQATNFRRRETCYMCNLSRKDGEVQEDTLEISTHPTNTVLLRGLDALTTEENVLHSIKTISSLPIKSVRIGRDAATGASRGVCYLEMNNVVDAMYLHNSLQASVPVVDEKTPKISYAKLDPLTLHSSATISGQIATAAVAAAQWSHQTTSSASEVSSSTTPATFKSSDVPRLAEYSASLYATNPQEKAAYLTYYEDYYKKQIADGQTISLPVNSATGLASAQAGLSAHKKSQSGPRTPLTEAPDGSGSCTYLPPDPSGFQYDSSSGYYYDSYTTLYYDATSQYYYNNKLQKFLYWDAAKETYLNSPSDGKPREPQSTQMTAEEVLKEDEQKKGKEKEGEKDKVKVAKRIAKDMERWAKTLNQKKEIAKQNVVAQAAGMSNMKAAGAADIGYAVLERKDHPLISVNNGMDKPKIPESLVAAYGQGSDSEEDDESAQEDKMHTDWVKNVCLLCKRQFGSRDMLVKHQQMSDLHKENLAAWYRSKGLDPDDAQHRSKQYRDRAKERRLKYGEPDKPLPSKLKESYIKAREAVVSYEEPTKSGIGSDNLGNKLLQKMGWSEGMGLGKSNQGRTSIIQAERRNATAGLGTKSVGVTPGPGETYKDCVKKMMAIRYSELSDPS
ncbi:hypothetical protein GE061_019531 [Apolygus lucorum]|uniref:RNA-binding protein 5 n=1 Tax=Apolygus lucorum TaxID=248454 RepID=A0A8S9X8E3_APOLU|nr:hypothetical protein GE061_019531 [Apolygus lucorum]